MIHHKVTPGTEIFCHACRHKIAVVEEIEVEASHNEVKEKLSFYIFSKDEIITPQDFEFCPICKSLWFCKGYFLPSAPTIRDSFSIAREFENLNESVNFYYEKTVRQGRFIAELADDIFAIGPDQDPILAGIYQRLASFLTSEADAMRERVSKREEESD
jgi:hypothetical protein